MRIGDRVRINGHPSRYPWMEGLASETGTIREIDDAKGRDIPAYGVEGLLPDGLAWFGASYLEPAEAGEGAA